ncbi:hypothetical protein BDV93DRAFT_603786 [Ceratobasidium sp. AG-I]|nr:hypothetical protein BDV93DRAFT_603786 [Ceratobasidium sp. AG-I]
MIKAISVTQGMLGKDFKLVDERIDVVADRNSLRKLLRFVRANGSDRDPRPAYVREFRVDVQLAPNNRTLVLIPHEGNGVDSSSFRSYHRIIRYNLPGLRFLVRSEVDAVISASDLHPDAAKPKGGLEDLVNTFAQTSISGSTVPLKPEPVALKRPAKIINADGSKLRYLSHGELVPQSDIIDVRIFEIKSDVYPQLFLSQTPTTKLATQAKGRFNAIETYNNESQVLKETHDKMSPGLHALTEILTQDEQSTSFAKRANIQTDYSLLRAPQRARLLEMTSVRWPSGGKAVERRAHDAPKAAVDEAAWVVHLR